MRKSLSCRLAGLLVALALSAPFSAAHASAVFMFSFSNVTGATSGTVTGTVTLPDGNGTFAASAVEVDSGPASLGFTFPTFVTSFIENSFTVSAGSIDPADVHFVGLINPNTALALDTTIVPVQTFLDSLNGANLGATGVQDAASSTLSFSSAAAVPEPSAAALVALALAGIAVPRIRTARR